MVIVLQSSPVCLVACKPGGTVGHALPGVDDEAVEVGQVHPGAELGRDAAPALELVGAGRALGHAAALVVVVQAGRARRVAVRLRAAAQALAVAALAPVRTRLLAGVRANWRRRYGGGGGPMGGRGGDKGRGQGS